MIRRKRQGERSGRATTALYILALVAVLYWARPVLVPFALAILLTFLLAPLVARVERVVRSRGVAVGIVTLVVIGMFAGSALIVGQRFMSFAEDLPAYRDTIVRKVRTIQSGPGSLYGRTAEVVRGIGEEIAKPAEAAPNEPTAAAPPPPAPVAAPEPARVNTARSAEPPQLVWAVLRPLVEPLASAAIVILLLVIMLVSRESIRDRLIRLAGLQQIGLTTQMLGEAGARVGSYLRAHLLINTMYGACAGVGLLVIGIPSPVLGGLFAGVTRFIPVVGPWIGAAVPAALGLAVFDDWHHVLFVALLFATLEILSNTVFEPWLYGSSTGLSSFGVVVAIIFWTWVWGAVGLILAVPMTACLIVFARQVPQLGALAILLGDEPVLAGSMRFYQRLLCEDDDEAAAILAKTPAEADPAEALDDVVIRGLGAARADQQRGLITAAQGADIAVTAREVAGEWLAEREVPAGEGAATGADSRPRVLCIPNSDEIDEAAAGLLALLLRREGIGTEVASAALLLSERVGLAAAPGIGVVVVCAASGSMQSQQVRLCKALARRVPQLPVVLVDWEQDPARHIPGTGEPGIPYAICGSSRLAIRTVQGLLSAGPRDPAQIVVAASVTAPDARDARPEGRVAPATP